MPKEIMIVYQDCPTCGARKEWGEKTIKEALNAKAFVRKVSFVTREGEQLIAKAVENGITRLPFVTDGKTFAYDVKSLIEAESCASAGEAEAQADEKKPKTTTKQSGVAEKTKKTKKVKAELQNESD